MSGAGGGVMASAEGLSSELRDGAARVIDVRKPEEYARGHIPSAVNLPLSELLADDGEASVAGLAGRAGIGDSTRVVAYDDTFGALASRLVWSLEHIGHADVSLLDSTYSQWAARGLETSTEAPSVERAEHSVRPRPEILATAGYLEEAASRRGTVLIDNRERLNYLESHIPGAINIPYRTLGDDARVLRPAAEISRILENRGVRPDSEAITYCGSVGTLSGLAYCALRSAGMGNVRLYVRSFREWKGLEKPLEAQADANYWDLSAE